MLGVTVVGTAAGMGLRAVAVYGVALGVGVSLGVLLFAPG